MKKTNFASEIQTAIDVALLREKAAHHVAGDTSKNKPALLIILISAVLGALGLRYFGSFISLSWGGVVSHVVYQTVMAIIGIYVISLIAKSLFKGHSKHDAFFRAMGYAYIVTWLGIVPALGIIGGIWSLVLLFSLLKSVHKLSSGAAVGTILVSILAFFVLGLILGPTMAMLGLKGAGSSMSFKSEKLERFYNGDAESFNMDIKTEEGTGSVKMEDGVMKITGPDGESIEVSIPQ
ncbi:MAG: YIP1 family protein [Candidatus Peregrinibacteria bacterium]|nr:YIP1 family protein [Candidatus Peregrinibacteria bacterium]